MDIKDMIGATSGSLFLLIEAFQAIAGEGGDIVGAIKIMMVILIVLTSTIGTLAKDADGDGVPDIYRDIQRLFGKDPKRFEPKPAGGRRKKRRHPPEEEENNHEQP